MSGVPEGKRGLATGIVGTRLASGYALGPAVAGGLFRITGGWRFPLAFMAGPTALLAIVFIFLVQEAHPELANGQLSIVTISWLADLVANGRFMTLCQADTLSSAIGMSSVLIGPAINACMRDQSGFVQDAFLLGVALALIGVVACSLVREAQR